MCTDVAFSNKRCADVCVEKRMDELSNVWKFVAKSAESEEYIVGL